MIKKIVVKNNIDLKKVEEIIRQAISTFEASGVQEFSINEEQVDNILGQRAYSGGDIPSEVIDEVDEALSREGEISFFFMDDDAAQRFVNYLDSLKVECYIEDVEQEDWDEKWRKSYQLIKVDPELWIIPEWMKHQFSGDHCLYIYPGQGFGTGSHETTYLCLEILTTIWDMNIENVLDLGCGSGILGAAYLKRQRNKNVVFCDIDKAALENTLQNLSLNFSGDDLSSCRLVLRERLKNNEGYDLIFANILLNALEQEREFILSSLNPDGYLIASGLLREQRDKFLDFYNELELIKTVEKGDWIACFLRKR